MYGGGDYITGMKIKWENVHAFMQLVQLHLHNG